MKRDWNEVKRLLKTVLYQGEMGARAAREGWCYELKHFLVENGRVPGPAEIERLKQSYSEVEKTMADLERRAAAGEDIYNIEVLRRMAAHVPIREARLAEQILERAAA